MIFIRGATVEDSPGPFQVQVNSHRAGCASLMIWVLEHRVVSRRFYERLGGPLLDARQVSQGRVEICCGWHDLAGLCRQTPDPAPEGAYHPEFHSRQAKG